jgi:hypothetical protein
MLSMIAVVELVYQLMLSMIAVVVELVYQLMLSMIAVVVELVYQVILGGSKQMMRPGCDDRSVTAMAEQRPKSATRLCRTFTKLLPLIQKNHLKRMHNV